MSSTERTAEDDRLIREMVERAERYLRGFEWCGDIIESYVGIAVGGVVAVILFRIKPTRKEVDEWLWVVVGDVPPAYLVTEAAPDPAGALTAYVREMTLWVEAVQRGESVGELIPVESSGGGARLDPTPEVAADLAKRLQLIDQMLLGPS